jgi:hypothetical protein
MVEHDGLEELLDVFHELRINRGEKVPRSARLELRENTAAERMPARHCPSVGRMVDELIMVETRSRVHSRTTTRCREAEFTFATTRASWIRDSQLNSE